ncbi:MAG: EAL domain-containing protein [Cyanobacteria bacterium P01_D01_bin.56]
MDKVTEILFEKSTNGVCFVAPAGRFLRVNARLCEMLGYSEAELMNLDFQTITHPDDLSKDMANVRRVLDGETDDYEMAKRYLHGTKRSWWWAWLSVSCIRDNDGNVIHFISQIREISTQQLKLEEWRCVQNIKRALDQHEIQLHWQPIVSLPGYETVGHEGLARWHHKDEILSPGAFIPLLEATQNLHLLCYSVIETVERGQIPSSGWVSINLANATIQRKDFQVKSQGLKGHSIHIEMLETAVIDSEAEALICQLRERGLVICIDDYGSGYSNQRLLAREKIPFDILKVDQSLIQLLGTGDRAYDLCQDITVFARRWGLKTIAEGVETEEQADLVTRLGFDMAQGRLFGWPEPLEALAN